MVTTEGTDFLLTRSTEKERERRGLVCLNSSTGMRREGGLELCHEHTHKAQAAQVGWLEFDYSKPKERRSYLYKGKLIICARLTDTT